MGTPLEDLRKELSELSSQATKFAITSLVILAVVSLTFGRALRTVDSDAVNALVQHVGKLVFEEQLAEDAMGIEEALAKLSASFEVDLPVSGAKLRINLLYWSGALPFFVLFSFAYLAIMAAKVRAVRIIADSRIPPLWELIYWVIPSGLYIWMTVIRPRRWIATWRSRTRRIIWLLYAPAILVAPLAMLWFMRGGIFALFGGLAALAIAFTCAPAAVPAVVNERSDVPLQVSSPPLSDQTA